MPTIAIEHLAAKYDQSTVLHDITMELPDNKVCVLVGPSGSGKSTLLMAVAGLVTPAAGRIRIGSDTVFDSTARRNVPTERRGIGLVFQSHALWGHMTVAQNVAFPLRQQRPRIGRAEITRRVEEMLALVGLAGLERRYPGQLSGGQAQRVSLARGLVPHPRVLLLDEPLSSVDAKVRSGLRQLIRQLQAETGTTMLMVTHDRADAEQIADNIVVMKDGQIIENGPADDLLNQPRRTFTAEFLLDAVVLEGWRDADALLLADNSDRIPFTAVRARQLSGGPAIDPSVNRSEADGTRRLTRYGVTGRSFIAVPDERGTGTIEAVSRTGGQYNLRVRLRGGAVISCLSPDPAELGAPVNVSLREDKLFELTD